MLTKEQEMLQPDAFSQHTMQQNAPGLHHGPRWRSLQHTPHPLVGFMGPLRCCEGGDGRKKRKGK